MVLVFILMSLGGQALAQEPGIHEPPLPREKPGQSEAGNLYGEVLANAKRRYFSGNHLDALDLLQSLEIRLLQGEFPGADLKSETLVFLGEVLFVLDRKEEALRSFTTLLQTDPEFPISPYHHPIEVVRAFESTREEVHRQSTAALAPPDATPFAPPPLPLRGYMPLGIPQFTEGRVGAGLWFGSLQVGLGIASLAMYSQLDANNVAPDVHPQGWTEEEVMNNVQNQRYMIQWPLGIAFYGTWLWSHSDARRSWKGAHQGPVAWVPNPRANGFALEGRF
jgi:hypothetical protein